MAEALVRTICKAWILAAALAMAGTARAEAFTATVTRVSDGDSVWVQPAAGGSPRVVRLSGLDAPEICQAHGRQARAALAQRVLHQTVIVQSSGRDRYRRLLARLGTDDEPDMGAWLVAQGHAWSWRVRDDAGPYAAQQGQAREARLGLWAQASPQEPRLFRRTHGPCGR